MTTHNALAFSPDLIRAFSKFTGLGENEGGVERLGETFTPVFDPRLYPDFSFLRDERLLGLLTVQAAGGAGTTSMLAIVNDTPNLLVTVEEAYADQSPTQYGIIDNASAAITGATNITVGTCRDSRFRRGSGMAAGNARVVKNTPAGGSGFSIVGTRQANIPFQVPFVIAPGAAFVMESVNNVTLNGYFIWRERKAYPGELPR